MLQRLWKRSSPIFARMPLQLSSCVSRRKAFDIRALPHVPDPSGHKNAEEQAERMASPLVTLADL